MKYISAFIFGILLAIGLTGCDIRYSEGARTGVIQKFSKKGMMCDTYEGEAVTEGFRFKGNQTRSYGSNVWSFSVRNPEVAKAVDQAMSSGEPVRLTYVQRALHNPCKSGTEYDVVSVQAVGN